MQGISIRYECDGDESEWEAVISAFIAAVDADAELSGRFRYVVNKAREGSGRVHWGSWDRPETVQLLQSREYFKAFAAQLKELAGDTLSPMPVTEWRRTAD